MPETPPLPTRVAASDSASPVAAKKLDNTLQHIGASGDDRPPRRLGSGSVIVTGAAARSKTPAE